MVFVDGLGLGQADASVNPLYSGVCPSLLDFIRKHAVPVDVTMNVPGLPQSATGQTALLTGINAARLEGRHIEAFPGPSLKQTIRQHNIFRQVLERGKTAAFANAYYTDDMDAIRAYRRQSVTTVATLSAFDEVRSLKHLKAGQAVFHDLNRAGLRQRGYDTPLIAPREAAGHLINVAREHHFTLFEYFQTDRAGHSNDAAFKRRVLAELDEFFAELVLQAGQAGLLLALASDHGNIEDSSTTAHTFNPVPFAAAGPKARNLLDSVKSITDVTPALLDCI